MPESSIAPNDVTIVPMIRSRAPNSFSGAFQTLFEMKLRPKCLIAGHAPSTIRQMIAATSATEIRLASAVSQ